MLELRVELDLDFEELDGLEVGLGLVEAEVLEGSDESDKSDELEDSDELDELDFFAVDFEVVWERAGVGVVRVMVLMDMMTRATVVKLRLLLLLLLLLR